MFNKKFTNFISDNSEIFFYLVKILKLIFEDELLTTKFIYD